ncbi:MAG: peptidylprolyl isomerase [Bacteroidota bacterium]
MIKRIITPLALLMLLVVSSCKERYPDLEDGLYAEFVTNKDTMVAKLYYKKAPVTVANFVALAEGIHPLVKDDYKNKRYYDGTTFHRVKDKFMIQGGDPTATGSGDPGYKFEDEFVEDLKHSKPGILSMANSGPNTNGSQFFITEVPTPFLDAYQSDGTLKRCGPFPGGGCHAVFGELVKGLDVQDAISNVEVAPGNDKPIEDVVILQLNIIRKGTDAKNFKADKVFTDELPKIQERQAEREAKLKAEKEAREKEAKAAFLELNEALKDRVEVFPSGMSMAFIEKAENGVKPNSSQRVLINCAGYFEDGGLFYTTWKDVAELYGQYSEAAAGRYRPFPDVYNQNASLVPGFKEAMLKMNVGDKARVYIPYALGYGERGRAPLIPPKTNLVFDVEIAEILK